MTLAHLRPSELPSSSVVTNDERQLVFALVLQGAADILNCVQPVVVLWVYRQSPSGGDAIVAGGSGVFFIGRPCTDQECAVGKGEAGFGVCLRS